MWEEFGPSVSLEHFPKRTSPFWNMKHGGDDIFNKVDVILFGQETIGSAERATNVNEMKYYFNTISNGGYKDKLYELFGEKRVNEELNKYLSFNFFPRFGGGIGITRLLRALTLQKEMVLEVI
jgi:aspartyl/asparaginyl-tRNA synthetase